MKSASSGDIIELLEKSRGMLPNRSGGWLIGKGVYTHGYELMAELLPQKTYFHVLILNALGRMPEDRFCKWLEAIYICMSWPDPRIWCNTLGSLAGTARTSSMAATFAGLIASESVLYGTKTLVPGMEFILGVKKLVDEGANIGAAIEALATKSGGKLHVPGYLRPIADGDIRIKAMNEYARKLGYTQGDHLELAWQVESYLHEKYDQSMNVSGYITAFLADQEISPQQSFDLFSCVVSSGITACGLEDAQKAEGSFLPLHCEDIEYVGEQQRSLPPEYLNQQKKS